MSQKLVALAVPLVVLLVGAGASLAFTPSPSPVVAGAATEETAVAPVDESPVAPAEPADEVTPEPEAPAEPEPEPTVVVPVFEDVILRDLGQVSPFYHETWTFNVPDAGFRAFVVDVNLGDAGDPEWIAYCVQAILKDGAGTEVAHSSGAFMGSGNLLQWNQGDAPEDVTWVGDWVVELHVQGSIVTDYSVAVDVLF